MVITGDPPKLGNYPDATAVFDVDSIGLTNVVSYLNSGQDLGGNPIANPTGFFSGVGVNPGAIDLDYEIRRFEWKVKAGAEYAITQPVFDPDALLRFLDEVQDCDIPIIAGSALAPTPVTEAALTSRVQPTKPQDGHSTSARSRSAIEERASCTAPHFGHL